MGPSCGRNRIGHILLSILSYRGPCWLKFCYNYRYVVRSSGLLLWPPGASAEVVMTRFTKIGTFIMAARGVRGGRCDSIYQNRGYYYGRPGRRHFYGSELGPEVRSERSGGHSGAVFGGSKIVPNAPRALITPAPVHPAPEIVPRWPATVLFQSDHLPEWHPADPEGPNRTRPAPAVHPDPATGRCCSDRQENTSTWRAARVSRRPPGSCSCCH